MSESEQSVLQEVLRNPQNYGEATVGEMRIKAGKELSRLWRMEASIKREVESLTHIMTREA